MIKPRVLLLSAYEAGSHRHWREQLEQGLEDFEWQVLSLPPRHFAWRVRGNPLYWSISERERLEAGYDLILATSMVDIATLRGLVPALAAIPTIVYFHENQFAYPDNQGRHGLLEPQMVSLYAALAADRLVFNSAFNMNTFLHGCDQMLGRFPDRVPAGIPNLLAAKSEVLAVPLRFDAVRQPIDAAVTEPLQIVWNHRWEYDKGPAELLQIAQTLVQRNVSFVLHVVGQQFRQCPAEFEALRALLEQNDARGQWGFIEQRSDYVRLLQSSQIVLSTALHDFQGISMLEACAAGCTPVAPARVVYPEWIPAELLYRDNEAAVELLADLALRHTVSQTLPRVDVSAYSATRLLSRYRHLMHSQIPANSVS
ncbi:tRNA-queuosine alpha-mannosyltransferase domain-containing protein [Candidatus Litorirhabdus singularis]|nr:DUF3524 domain-containing protein [Candidatus Litorirhabdus singularis]